MSRGINFISSFAKVAHAGQFRRDGVTPYAEHLAAVAARVHGDDEAEATAWLHDILEDTPKTAGDLRAIGISESVVVAVELLTHADNEPYQEYLGRLKSNRLAAKVKVADMLANLTDSPTERQIKKYAWGLNYLLN